MATPPSQPHPWQRLALLILPIAAAALHLAATSRYGIGLTGDSLDYLSTADHLAAGQGFTDFAGEPFIYWPPLYPLLLAGLKLGLGLDPMLAARALNALALALIVYLTGKLIGVCLPGKPGFQVLGAYLSAIFLPYLSIAAQIATDALFIALTLAYLLLALRWLQRGQTSQLVWMTAAAAAAGVLRWHGVVLIGCAGLFATLAPPGEPGQAGLRRRIGRASLVWAAAGLPFLAWVAGRNLAQQGSLFGPQRPFVPEPLTNLSATIDKVIHWLAPISLTRIIPAAALLAAGLLVAAWLLWRGGRLRSFAARLGSLPLYPVLVFGGAFLAFLIFTTNPDDQPGFVSDRYQAVLLAPILALGFTLLDELLQAIPLRRRTSGLWAAAGLILLWSVYPVYTSYKFVRLSMENGAGGYNMYNTRFHHESRLVADLLSGRLDPSLKLYSNLPEVVYAFTRQTTFRAPHDPQPYPETRAYLEQYAGWPGAQPVYLVWVEPNTRRNYFTPQELASVAEVIPIVEYNKYGGIYLVRPR